MTIKMTTAEQMVTMLKLAGIKRIYGVAGDSLNFFIDALRREGSIQWVHVRHEEVGAFAAMAEGALGGLGCCAGSSGPGHVHLLNGLYDAQRWGAPVIGLASTIISDDYGSESFQSTDLNMFVGCSHYHALAQTPKQVPRMLQQALQQAWSRKGVGVFAFPGNLMSERAIKELTLPTLYPTCPRIQPNRSELQAVANAVNEIEDIGIYVGLGSIPAKEKVLALAEKIQAPIAHTLKAKMIFGQDNPYDVGMTGFLGSIAGAKAVTECKLLLLLGSDFPWVDFLNPKVKIIQIDTKPERLGRRVALHMGLAGDIYHTVETLLPLIVPKTNTTFLNTCLKAYESVQKTYEKHQDDKGEMDLIKPEYVMSLVNDMATPNAIFTVDTGMTTVFAARYLQTAEGRRLIGSFSHGSMANAMPQAIGAAFHEKNTEIVALCGDGGLSMLLGDLMTISQYKLPIKIIVFNNRSLGMVALEMQVAGLPNWQTDMQNPSFAEIAKACGIQSYKACDPHLLKEQLTQVFLHDGPVLIDVHTNPNVPVLPPHTSMGVISRYVSSEIKLTRMGRLKEAWRSLKTSVQYLRDLI